MVERMIINVVGNYTENDWQNPRTGEKKTIKSLPLILQTGNNTFMAEAQDDVAKTLKDMNLHAGQAVIVSLSFLAQRSEKENNVRYFQRVRIEKLILL